MTVSHDNDTAGTVRPGLPKILPGPFGEEVGWPLLQGPSVQSVSGQCLMYWELVRNAKPHDLFVTYRWEPVCSWSLGGARVCESPTSDTGTCERVTLSVHQGTASGVPPVRGTGRCNLRVCMSVKLPGWWHCSPDKLWRISVDYSLPETLPASQGSRWPFQMWQILSPLSEPFCCTMCSLYVYHI